MQWHMTSCQFLHWLCSSKAGIEVWKWWSHEPGSRSTHEGSMSVTLLSTTYNTKIFSDCLPSVGNNQIGFHGTWGWICQGYASCSLFKDSKLVPRLTPSPQLAGCFPTSRFLSFTEWKIKWMNEVGSGSSMIKEQ